MLLYCIISSVTAQVMDRLALKNHFFTLQVREKSVQDCVYKPKSVSTVTMQVQDS
jgi:hypothetical protein